MKGSVDLTIWQKGPKSEGFLSRNELNITMQGDKELLDLILDAVVKKIECNENLKILK